MHLEDPLFPPLLKGHAVKSPVEPMAHACRLARTGKLGAGDVVWSRNAGRAEVAIVLEPEVALARALQMGPLLMVAVGDCLGTLCPPKVAIQYRWPGGILVNGAIAGEVRIAAPRASIETVPEWLVIGATLDIAAPRAEREDWSRTSLSEEAGGTITRTNILQSLSAHFLTWLNIWNEDGFRPVHDQWLFRAEGREAPVGFAHEGARVAGRVLGLDEGANLLVKTDGGQVCSLPFLDYADLFEPTAS